MTTMTEIFFTSEDPCEIYVYTKLCTFLGLDYGYKTPNIEPYSKSLVIKALGSPDDLRKLQGIWENLYRSHLSIIFDRFLEVQFDCQNIPAT